MGILKKLFNIGVRDESNNYDEIVENKKINDDKFYMMVEDVFTITGRGTVVTGRIESGCVKQGDTIKINGIETKVLGIEMFRKTLDYAEAGDNVGLLITLGRNEVNRFDEITK